MAPLTATRSASWTFRGRVTRMVAATPSAWGLWVRPQATSS